MSGHDQHPPQGSNSSAELDARTYKMLWEFDRRLDEKFKEARAQNKEDIKTAIEIAVNPIIPRLDNIDSRLENGEKRFNQDDKRLSDHSERIDDVKKLLASEGISIDGPRRKQEATTAIHKKPEVGWISAASLPAIIAAIGSVVATILASVAMMRNPQLPPQQVVSTPTPAIQGNPP